MDRLQTLFEGYLQHRLTADEFVELFELLGDEADFGKLSGPLQALWEEQPVYMLSDGYWEGRMSALREVEAVGHGLPRRRLWTWAAAAAVILLGSGTYWWFIHERVKEPTVAVAPMHKNDVPPGGNRAILILGDGRQLDLDSAGNGTLAQQGHARVVKLANGQIAYQPNSSDAALVFNTLATPRGGQYQLTLPDGSKVWLNAASSITYPTAFTGAQRKVTITGEAYFEVAQDAGRPFVVEKGSTQVQVLGTRFDVNSYADEPDLTVSLAEGKVEVQTEHGHATLVPGQQAVMGSGQLEVRRSVDMDEVLAWKNGMFRFNGTDLATIMRQVSRWYDVEVVFKAPIHEKFFAEISRNTNASNLFKILAITQGAHFQIEGKRVIVTP